ncbi:MAG: lipoprotein-releasing ABC transporter permease subunit [Deltaproteobacteria bacterium]|nr:lipoprotein-releasing ABC transporter permease subunit [Deltaproteobacteria bacterium]
MSFELFVSCRYLLARRKQAFISVISLISVVGVALGVASLIVVLGVMNGFSDNLRDKILGVNAHLIVVSMEKGIPDYRDLAEKCLQVPRILAATPFIYSEVMLSTPSGVKGVVLRGIDPKTAGDVLSIGRDMREGRLEDLDLEGEFPGVIVGADLANRLGLGVGSRISVLAPSGKVSSAGFTPKIEFFTVVGVFKSGMFEYDSTLAYTGLAAAQNLLGFAGDLVSGLELRVADVYAVQEVQKNLLHVLGGYPLYGRNWIEMNQNLFSALELEKTAMAVILVMIVLVGSFSIITTLVMMVMEKTRDIAVLVSLGATPERIRRIFMLQGTTIGVVGTVAGFILGVGVSLALKRYQFIKLPLDVYYLDHLPVHLRWTDLTLIGISAMVLCFLATIYPARQAARMQPADALRYE